MHADKTSKHNDKVDNGAAANSLSADTVMTMPGTNIIQRKCAHCDDEDKEKETIQRKPLPPFVQKKGTETGSVTNESVSNNIDATKGNGSSMDDGTRSFMENRFGTNFSGVNIHTNDTAVQMSRELNAKAFTTGKDIYFNEGQYQPHSSEGKSLLAHELTHTIQQGSVIRRSPLTEQGKMPKDILGRPLGFFPTPEQEEYDRESVAMGFDRKATLLEAEIWFHPVCQKQKDKAKGRVRRIMDMAKTKPPGSEMGQRMYYLEKLRIAITTPFDGIDTGDEDYGCSPENETKNRADVDAALVTEKKDWNGFLADVEEDIVATGKTLTPRTGEDKDEKKKTFTVDRTDVKNIRVHIKIKLNGPKKDVEKIKGLEDAIERNSWMSTKGYFLDIEFVDKSGKDVFEIDVEFCKWPNSGDWASDPMVLSHEVHHALGLPDRYNYIESHSDNDQMNVASRLEWFEEEMNKKTPNNPRSKMATNENALLNDDVCWIAFDPGADRDKCIEDRNKFNPAGVP
ncbi:MAG: DUF4157 domain-containing protein [Chitinophagaceae bacterium]